MATRMTTPTLQPSWRPSISWPSLSPAGKFQGSVFALSLVTFVPLYSPLPAFVPALSPSLPARLSSPPQPRYLGSVTIGRHYYPSVAAPIRLMLVSRFVFDHSWFLWWIEQYFRVYRFVFFFVFIGARGYGSLASSFPGVGNIFVPVCVCLSSQVCFLPVVFLDNLVFFFYFFLLSFVITRDLFGSLDLFNSFVPTSLCLLLSVLYHSCTSSSTYVMFWAVILMSVHSQPLL